jgi:hypothetical protein
VKRNLARVFFSIVRLTQGFEVELVVFSPLTYLVVRALAALCYSVRRIRLPVTRRLEAE